MVCDIGRIQLYGTLQKRNSAYWIAYFSQHIAVVVECSTMIEVLPKYLCIALECLLGMMIGTMLIALRQ
jgi:hypothetical protein